MKSKDAAQNPTRNQLIEKQSLTLAFLNTYYAAHPGEVRVLYGVLVELFTTSQAEEKNQRPHIAGTDSAQSHTQFQGMLSFTL